MDNLILKFLHAHAKGYQGTPAYSKALKEINNGCKVSHWIWYIWPILKGLRQTSMPWFEFDDFSQLENYILNDTLRNHLIEITTSAMNHLSRGVPPHKLFGVQHKYDTPKFYQCISGFAIAARLLQNRAKKVEDDSKTEEQSEEKCPIKNIDNVAAAASIMVSFTAQFFAKLSMKLHPSVIGLAQKLGNDEIQLALDQLDKDGLI
jgi:uncharacterized protein (DUF1810 family)